MFSVFKTGVSSDSAQAGSIPVRLRYLALRLPAKQLRSGDLLTIPPVPLLGSSLVSQLDTGVAAKEFPDSIPCR